MKKLLLSLPVFVSVATLFFLYRKIPLQEVAAVLCAVDARRVVLALFLVAATHFAIAMRLRILALAQGFQLRLSNILAINLASHFYKLIFPGGMTTLVGVRSFKLYRAEGRVAGALWTSLFDRILATTGLGLIGLICWLLDPSAWNHVSAWIFCIGLTTSAVAVTILLSSKFSSLITKLFRRVHPGAGSNRISRGIADLHRFREIPRSDMILLLATSLVPHVLGIMVYWLLASSCGITIGIFTIGWIRSIAVFGVMLPMSIGGLGIRDGIFILFFSQYYVSKHITMAFALLVFASTILLPAIVGAAIESFAAFRVAISKAS